MAVFQRESQSLHFEVHHQLVPQDTLFIHGNLASNRWWYPSMEEWQREAKRAKNRPGDIILAEWRGCGQSKPIPEGSTFGAQVLAEDYLKLLEMLKKPKVNVVAHSTGALITLQALLMEPNRFEKVVLLDPVPVWGFELSAEMIEAFRHMQADREYCATVMATCIDDCDTESAFFQGIVDDAYGVDPKIWEWVPWMLSQTNLEPQLPSIEHPTLVLHGEKDGVLSIEDSRRLSETLKNSVFAEMKDYGHSLHVEDPDIFRQSVNTFLFPEQKKRHYLPGFLYKGEK